MKQRQSIWLAVALLCAGLGTTGWGQKKSGDKAMAEAARAVELAQQGAFPEAIAAFTKAIEARPKDERLYIDRGGIYLTTRQFQEAANDFTKAIELDAKNVNAYSLRGAALAELNQFDAAMADMNKALEVKPDDPKTLERRGYVYYKQRNYEAALADYNSALEKTPDSTLGLARRADAYVALKRFPEAKQDLEKVLQLRPEDFAAEDRLRYVNAQLAPRPVATPAGPIPTPAPTPIKLLTRTNVFIALGGLLVLGIIIVVIAKLMMTRSSD